MDEDVKRVTVTGGAGYVGAVLTPKLLEAGYEVCVLDWMAFGTQPLAAVAGHPRLTVVEGDLRQRDVVERAMAGADAVIHLACISNDPSFELDPSLGKSINLDAFPMMLDVAKACGVRRFVYASSSSVYGVRSEPDVTEEMHLEPLTDYSRFKAECERLLLEAREPGFETLTIRPATVCGMSPRLRLDLIVNILTNLAYHDRRITVHGGDQRRPNIHIEDITDLYVQSLQWPAELVDGRTYNVGADNHTVAELAEIVREEVSRTVGPVEVVTEPVNDPRSYHISSEAIARDLGFRPRRSIRDAVRDLVQAFEAGAVPDARTDPRYYNIRTMQAALERAGGAA